MMKLTAKEVKYMVMEGIKLPDNLTVNGDLDLRNTQIGSIPDNLTVSGDLDLSHTQIKSLPNNLVVRGFLDLAYTQIKSLPNNLIVRGDLYLNHTQIESLPNNLVVGGILDLGNTQIKSLPDSLRVGKFIHAFGTEIDDPITRPENSKYYLKEGDYVPGKYLYADGILTLVKREKKYGKYTIYVGKIKGKNVIYDGVNYAHCDKISDGIEDLEYKSAKDRGVEQYKKYTLDSVVSLNEAKTMYRVITGSCRAGVNNFVDNMKEVKDKYTIQEIIDITKDAYRGYMFHNFFTNTNT